MENNKIYYFHTPDDEFFPGWQAAHRATVACQRQGDKIIYGISICTAGDNFSRKKGRYLAEERMREGYGSCDFNNNYYNAFQKEELALIDFAIKLGTAVHRNFNKHKRRIGNFVRRHVEG